MISVLVFDFDGLILDTEVPVFLAWARVYEEHGVELDFASWQAIIGTDFDPSLALEERLGRRLEWPSIDERRRRHRDELQAREEMRPGVADWLAAARRLGLRVGVASSSSRAWVTGHLERLGLLGHVGCIRCRDDVGAAKPDPSSYRAVIAHFGVDPGQALAIEDSAHGVAAAKAAGLWCVAVPSSLTVGLDFSDADVVIASLADVGLEEVLARLPAIRG